MRNIEEYFKDNKQSFDSLKADDAIWEGIQSELNPPKQGGQRHLWLKFAASIAFILALTVLLYQYNTKSTSTEVIGTEKNMVFPEIALRNPMGELIPLSSLKGKVVLVEFWASHSKVCTQDHCYYFKPIYDEFKDKGFEIYAVSVDTSAVCWVDAIRKDDLDWVQVSDLQGIRPEYFEDINLEDLPITFLLDEEGKVIAKDIDNEKLKEKLHQLLALQE